ncbi:MAG: glutamate formimidoyltransferase [Syntrophales bacterium]|nr:glutamate formimidoyltransferase [Syntrophales bacterium]
MKIIECIPNFSEGRNRSVVEAIVDAAAAIHGIRILDYSMDEDHNRSVLTFIGSPEAVEAAAALACDKAVQLIDMSTHTGIHPRIGAVDVVPFVPLQDAVIQDAVRLARRFGRAFAKRNNVPVYFYGAAALKPERSILSAIRRGEYETLRNKMSDPMWRPDAGPADFNARCGATAVGARKPLIAFNINLKSCDIEAAHNIARSVRQSGGGLSHVQALGLHLKSRNIVQISMNLTDFETTSLCKVFDAVKEKAAAFGIDVLESELIGLIPEAALEGATAEYLQICNFGREKIIEQHIKNKNYE